MSIVYWFHVCVNFTFGVFRHENYYHCGVYVNGICFWTTDLSFLKLDVSGSAITRLFGVFLSFKFFNGIQIYMLYRTLLWQICIYIYGILKCVSGYTYVLKISTVSVITAHVRDPSVLLTVEEKYLASFRMIGWIYHRNSLH